MKSLPPLTLFLGVAAALAILKVPVHDWRVGARSPAVPPGREIAVTFDDLPAVSVARGDPASLATFTDRLLVNFTSHAVPVVGFVNEGKLPVPGEGLDGQSARIALLAKWLAAGFELGNHTYSHRSLNDLPIEEFQADVVRGEPVTSTLLGASGRGLRYSADRYVGRWRISCMHHWEQTMGRPRTGSPDPPGWVSEAYLEGRR